MHQLAEILTTLSRIADRVLQDPEKGRFLISLLAGQKGL
jgi:hypothetical protein